MQKQITNSRAQIRRNETFIKSYRKAVYDVAQHIDDYDQLKLKFHECLYTYVADSQRKQEDVDKDIKKEFQAQAKYLGESNKTLQRKLNQQQTLQKEDNFNIMKLNMDLIADVNDLRSKVKEAKLQFNKDGGTKQLDQIKAAKERLAQDNAEQTNFRHAGLEDELEQVDGFNNNLAENLAVKKKYIK